LTGAPVIAVGTAFWYASLHYLVTPAVLVLVWRKAPSEYSALRTALLVATLLALALYSLIPVAPPRLTGDPSYVDTRRATSQWGWWGAEASAPRGLGALTNQFAAMPSMHVGWAVWCAVDVRRVTRSRPLRSVAVAYPVLTSLAVVATANHWTMDAVAGAALVLLTLLPVLRPEGSGRLRRCPGQRAHERAGPRTARRAASTPSAHLS
jgi:hypothetical protein